MQNMEQTVHNFTDLDSCYDRQLANVCRVVEEAVELYWMAIKLFTKVIPRFEHCIHTNFWISEGSYGGRNDPLGSLGKRMELSGSTKRDISCFMFKALEEKWHGFINIDSIKLGERLKTVSAFADDTNLWEMCKAAEKRWMQCFKNAQHRMKQLEEKNQASQDSLLESVHWKRE